MQITDIVINNNKDRLDHIAIYDEQGSLSYGDLFKEINALSSNLSIHGIKAGMGVGVMGKNSRQFIISVFACLKLEAVVMPISNQLKTDEVNQILDRAGLHYILDDGNGPDTKASKVQALQIDNLNWTLSKHTAFDGKRFAGHVEDAAIVRYTSGTTGTSKGVIIGHQSIDERINAANKLLDLGPNDTVIWVLQMSYHFVVSIILYLKFGSSIALCKDFLANTIVDYTKKYNGSFLYASPLHIRLLSTFKENHDLSSLKRVISTSTAISKAQCEAFYNKYQIPISQAYGIIEIGLPIINHDKGQEHPDTVGKALPDYNVSILDDENKIVSDGQIGHLAIKGPGMFDAYLEPAQMKSEILNDGWFMTGDLASKSQEGIIKVEGRKKSMINVSGNKVFPIEVEQVLDLNPDIKLSRVSGYTHRIMGEIVKAEIVLNPNIEADAEAIISYCRKRLTTYKIPQKIVFVDALPMTDSGKLKRH